MNVLLLSTGGGGGNILRSVKTLFERDLAATDATDPVYASRLRAAISTCFLDTNEFSMTDVPAEERLLIGARTTGHLGARHNPEVAKQALEESKSDVEAVIKRHSVIIVIGTGGKGTGAGTILPLAHIARQHRKLVIPIFVRPSFERHEVDKRRYDHALAIGQQFDAAHIRLIEILNDRGYDDAEPQPQSTVWERMNQPIARALRGLLYVLWDLSQVDPSDLSTLLAGPGRLRLGFGRIAPANGVEPSDSEIQQAARECWANPYYGFSKPVGTSLICIQGEWSNVADARLKGELTTSAATGMTGSPYTPLYTRAAHSPKPWGITALFSEHTGLHVPIDVEWSLDRINDPAANSDSSHEQPFIAVVQVPLAVAAAAKAEAIASGQEASTAVKPTYTSLWEFAVAVNRSEAAALAIARDVATDIAVDGLEVKKLLGTVWFRTVVPRLSEQWRTRLFGALVKDVVVVNHMVKVGRRLMPLGELTISQVRELATNLSLPDTVRPDLDLLVTIGRLWGDEALARLRFSDAAAFREPSKFASLLVGLRG